MKARSNRAFERDARTSAFAYPLSIGLAPLNFDVDMAYFCQAAKASPAFFYKAFVFDANPIGDAAGITKTTVDQADMRALVSRRTVVHHGAASL